MACTPNIYTQSDGVTAAGIVWRHATTEADWALPKRSGLKCIGVVSPKVMVVQLV